MVSRPFLSPSLIAMLALVGSTNLGMGDEFPADRPLSFVNDVIPVMTKVGCNRGACHGAALGKGNFKLSLRGASPAEDFLAIQRDQLGRRVDRLTPANSLFLLKPTMTVNHLGGQILTTNSEAYQTLHAWIAQGMPGASDTDPKIESLDIVRPESPLLLDKGEQSNLVIQARYSDGSVRDVTRWSRYETNDSTITESDKHGRITAVGSGKAAISVNYQGKFSAVEVVVPFAPTVDENVYATLPRTNYIDEILIHEWQRLRLIPSPVADDATFLRRAYLDITGTLPSPEQVTQFIDDPTPLKRALLVEKLLASSPAIDLWMVKLGDIFRTSSEWLGAEGLQAFNAYLRGSLTSNQPYNQLVRELVSGSGDAFQVGPPNYVRLYVIGGGALNWHMNISESVAQTFLGVRLQCARCHDHPVDIWTQDDYFGWAGFFARVKKTRPADKPDGTESIIAEHGTHEVKHPHKGVLPPRTLDGLEMERRRELPTLWENAHWIWDAPDAAKEAEADIPRYFRKTIELSEVPLAAQIYCTADDVLTVYVNGEKIGHNEPWKNIQRYDLTTRLQAGKNVLAMEAVNRYGPGSLLAWLHLVQADFTDMIVSSDGSFKVSQVAPENWRSLEFDDIAWAAAIVQGESSMEPWKIQPAPADPIGPDYTPRREFLADWLTSSDNRRFARMAVNRIWRHFMGRGIVEPVDDFRLTNPPTNPVLLDALAADFVEHSYDMRYLMTQIVKSQAYQLSSTPTNVNRADTMFYSHYYPRRMMAEQILDALCQVTGIQEDFPEVEKGTRAQQLPDTKVSSSFLDTFGRPLRRTPSCECERIQDPNLGQVLELMNGEEIHNRVIADEGIVHRALTAGLDDMQMLEQIYLSTVARLPQQHEIEVILPAVPKAEPHLRRAYFEDILWAILNGKEFLFNH